MTAGAGATGRRPAPGALAAAIERRDWDRVSLYLLIGVALAARAVPQATVDDLLDALTGDEADGRAPSGDNHGPSHEG